MCPKLANGCAWSIKYRYCSYCCLLWYNSDLVFCVPHHPRMWANLVTYKLLSVLALIRFYNFTIPISPISVNHSMTLVMQVTRCPTLYFYFILSCLRNMSSFNCLQRNFLFSRILNISLIFAAVLLKYATHIFSALHSQYLSVESFL